MLCDSLVVGCVVFSCLWSVIGGSLIVFGFGEVEASRWNRKRSLSVVK